MRSLLIILLVGALGFGAWWFFFKDKKSNDPTKQPTLTVTGNSNEFNQSVATVITEYLSLKEAFVNADTAAIKGSKRKFSAALENIRLGDLKNDSAGNEAAKQLLGDILTNADAILKETDITEMRQDFRMVSENLFPFLKAIHYTGQKLYWQNCPMAFGGGKEGSWLSSTEEILNPYLGKNHPEWKGTMLHCGEVKDSIQ